MKKYIFLLFVLLLAACKPSQVITIHDVEYRDRIQHDSVNTVKHDSIRITQKGDTVFYQSFKIEYRDRYKLLTDSVYKYKEIPVPGKEKTITVKVPIPLNWFQRTFILMGKVFAGLILILIIYIIVKLRMSPKDYLKNLLHIQKE